MSSETDKKIDDIFDGFDAVIKSKDASGYSLSLLFALFQTLNEKKILAKEDIIKILVVATEDVKRQERAMNEAMGMAARELMEHPDTDADKMGDKFVTGITDMFKEMREDIKRKARETQEAAGHQG